MLKKKNSFELHIFKKDKIQEVQKREKIMQEIYIQIKNGGGKTFFI